MDVAGGRAGTVLGLLRVHQLTGDGEVLDAARRWGDALLARRRREPEGVSWTPRGAAARPQGLPHGTGGIGLALLELYRATGEERWLFAAAQALRHEDDQPASVGAGWHGGAAGVALVRARFLEVTGLERHRAALAHASARCREHLQDAVEGDETLATGRFGCADALLEAARHTGEPDGRAAADAARRGLEAAAVRDGWPLLPPGLLRGAAGIGLFYLRIADPDVASALLPGPTLASPPVPPAEALLARGRHAAVAEWFGRTMGALARAGVGAPLCTPHSLAAARGELSRRIAALPDGARAPAGEAFALESLAWELSRHQADRFARGAAPPARPRGELLDDDGTPVRLSASARLFSARHGDAAGTYLVYDAEDGYTAQRLDGPAERMLSALETAVPVGALLDTVVEGEATRGSGGPDAPVAREALRAWLRQACARGIVDIGDTHGLTPADVTSGLCTRCGECCRVTLYIRGNADHRAYVAAVLEAPLRAAYPDLAIGHERTAAGEHVVLDLGYCRHLRRATDAAGHPTFQCGIYEQRPPVCRSFNCVRWWMQQRANATGPTRSDAVVERVAALKQRIEQERSGTAPVETPGAPAAAG